jgi:protein-S-isoprenylcysteine O-methyltransferase Ste14
MNPALRLPLVFGAWAFWLAPFILLRPGTKEKAVQVETRARAGIVLQGVAFVLVFMHTPAGWDLPLNPIRAALSVIASAVGIALAWGGVRALGRQWRVDAGLNATHELVRTGPYRLVRHPIYASMLCMLVSGIAGAGTLPGWPIAVVLFFIGIEIRVRTEDGLLRGRFGETFAEYARSTPAYIPFIR